MKPIFQYFLIALTTGSLGLVSGVWISRDDLPEETHTQSAVKIETIPYSQLSQQMDSQIPQELKLDDIYQKNNIFDQLHFTYTIARESDFKQLTKYLGLVIRDDDPLFNHNIASIFLERMVVLDPLSALEFIDTHRTMNQNSFISHVLTSWIRLDPEAAIDYFKSMTNKQLKYIVGARLLEDPTLRQSGLLAEIESELGSYSDRIIEQVRLKRMPAANAFEEALLRTDHRRREAMMSAVGRWYQEDPEAAMQRVAALTNQRERHQLMQVIISMQSRQDPEMALEMLALYAPDDKNLKRQALMNYANQDPERALPLVESWVAETGNYDIMSNLISRWVQTDEIAALGYVETIPEQHRQSVIQNLAFAYINHSPEKGMTWMMSLGPEYDQNAKRMALQALSRYPDIAENWLLRLDSEPELQGILLSQIAGRRAQSNPGDTYEWLGKYADSPQFQAARNSVLQTWARTEPQSVAALLDDNSEDPSYSHLFSITASTWVSRDIDAALNWIDSLPDSNNKEAALGSAISRITDPERAISLLEELPENKARNFRMQLAYNWLRRTPDDVETIIRRLELNDQNAGTLRRVQEQQSIQIIRDGGFR